MPLSALYTNKHGNLVKIIGWDHININLSCNIDGVISTRSINKSIPIGEDIYIYDVNNTKFVYDYIIDKHYSPLYGLYDELDLLANDHYLKWSVKYNKKEKQYDINISLTGKSIKEIVKDNTDVLTLNGQLTRMVYNRKYSNDSSTTPALDNSSYTEYLQNIHDSLDSLDVTHKDYFAEAINNVDLLRANMNMQKVAQEYIDDQIYKHAEKYIKNNDLMDATEEFDDEYEASDDNSSEIIIDITKSEE